MTRIAGAAGRSARPAVSGPALRTGTSCPVPARATAAARDRPGIRTAVAGLLPRPAAIGPVRPPPPAGTASAGPPGHSPGALTHLPVAYTQRS